MLLLVAAPVTSVLVLKGFVRERGRAIAYVELGMPVAAMIFVPLTQMFIDWWGWETTWIVLSAIGLGVIVPELISEVVEIEKAQVRATVLKVKVY